MDGPHKKPGIAFYGCTVVAGLFLLPDGAGGGQDAFRAHWIALADSEMTKQFCLDHFVVLGEYCRFSVLFGRVTGQSS
jgi:hypothetical protein